MGDEMTAEMWPADRVQRRNVAEILDNPHNARTHSHHQIEELAASIRQWGWTIPVLVDDDGVLIAGHGRVAAARHLGIESVPVMVASGWTDEQKRAYVIADNQLAQNAGWDRAVLTTELSALATSDFDLSLLGFNPAQLDRYIGPASGNFGPGTAADQGSLDELKADVECPSCGTRFRPAG